MIRLANFFTRSNALSPLLLACLLLIFSTSIASAHALLVKSEPDSGVVLQASPKQVTAWFSQELDTGFSTIQVFNTGRQQVDNGDGGVDLYDPDHASMVVTLPAALPDGIYTVRWTAVSAEDGDPTEGEYIFSIGQEISAVSSSLKAETSSIEKNNEWPVGQIAIAMSVLLGVIMAVIGYTRLIAKG